MPADRLLLHLTHPRLLQLRQVNVSTKLRDGDSQPQDIFKVPCVPVDEVVRSFVAFVDQVVSHRDDLDVGIVLRQGRQIWIVFPELLRRRPHVRHEVARMSRVEVAHGRGHHDDVTGAETAGQ